MTFPPRRREDGSFTPESDCITDLSRNEGGSPFFSSRTRGRNRVAFLSYNAKRAILRTEFQEHTEEAGGVCTDGRNQIWVCSGKNAANAENGHGKMTLLTDAPEEIRTGFLSDGGTLRAFIDYAAEKYPAERYDLILWDHGGGPQLGFGIDENDPDGNIMSVGAVARALKESRVERFDIVDFDACLMSSAEVAACLSGHADYLVLSAETARGREGEDAA